MADTTDAESSASEAIDKQQRDLVVASSSSDTEGTTETDIVLHENGDMHYRRSKKASKPSLSCSDQLRDFLWETQAFCLRTKEYIVSSTNELFSRRDINRRGVEQDQIYEGIAKAVKTSSENLDMLFAYLLAEPSMRTYDRAGGSVGGTYATDDYTATDATHIIDNDRTLATTFDDQTISTRDQPTVAKQTDGSEQIVEPAVFLIPETTIDGESKAAGISLHLENRDEASENRSRDEVSTLVGQNLLDTDCSSERDESNKGTEHPSVSDLSNRIMLEKSIFDNNERFPECPPISKERRELEKSVIDPLKSSGRSPRGRSEMVGFLLRSDHPEVIDLTMYDEEAQDVTAEVIDLSSTRIDRNVNTYSTMATQ